MQSSIEQFALCVPFWMVRRGSGLLDSIQFTQILHDLAFKVPALIRMNTDWNTIPEKTLLEQYFPQYLVCGHELVQYVPSW